MKWHSVLGLAVAGVVAAGFAGEAQAKTAAKEIVAYDNIVIVFTKNAADCDFTTKEPFERRLRQGLAAQGIRQDDNSIIRVYLEVGAIAYGALETQCAVDVNLSLRTTLLAENINTSNEMVRRAVDRLGSFPISLYQIGSFVVETTLMTVYDGRNITRAEMRALEMVDRLLQRLKEDREA